ncbi:MAG TPA: hypothetical protein VMT43_10335 [Acidimicrobiales bacterium]|nr:hypothetical protein [Acidimicrobiales bacterium]
MEGPKDEASTADAPVPVATAPPPPPASRGAVGADDPFDVLAGEIATMLRDTKEACRRIEAQAEERAAHTVEEAGAQAEELVADAEAHAAAQRAEVEAETQARRAEAQQLLDEAGRAREAAAAMMTQSRKLLADAERELAKSIDQANAMRAALEAIRSEVVALDEDHVIDLTDTPGVNGATGVAAEAVEGPTGDPAGDEALDGAVRDAVARAVEGASNAQDPPD